MTTLFWTPESIADRESIYDYIESDNPVAALALDELFSNQALLLTSYPGLGRLGKVIGTRELVVHPNYILVYDSVDECLRVLRVLHASMKWPPTL